LPDELPTLTKMLRQPNVTSYFDRLSISDLIRLIAHSGAVVTNDTSTAHLANSFDKPGAVLFGPARPDTFALTGGKLRVFSDASCPLHPCVQWSCRRENDWCMRKITVNEVAEHLGTLLDSATQTHTRRAIREFEVVGVIRPTD